MTQTDSRRLQRRLSITPARLDFGLPLATPPHEQSGEGGRGESSKKGKCVIEPSSKKEIRSGRPSPAQDARRRSPPSVETGYKLCRTPPKWREPTNGQFEDSTPETMPVWYQTQRYRPAVSVLALFKRSSTLPIALRDDVSRYDRPTLGSLLRSAFINKYNRANVFFTVDERKFLKEMAWARTAYLYRRTGGSRPTQQVFLSKGGFNVPARFGSSSLWKTSP